MKQVFLISCVKSKQTDFTSCPAEKMYTSPLYCASLSYALSWIEIKTEQIFILSALYGLLSLDESISYYEKTLGTMSATEQAEWGRKVSDQLAERFDIDNTCFVFLAGEKYVAPLRKYLGHYSEPLKGITGIGTRIRWLNENSRNRDNKTAVNAAVRSKAISSSHTIATKKLFIAALEQQMKKARNNGASSLTITSKELHQLVGGYPGPNHKMPTCCTVMYDAMGESDVIVAKPPSGKGASLKITYNLSNESTATASLSESPSVVFLSASKLRLRETLRQVPDKPGWYRWWAPESVSSKLLNSPYISENYTESLSPHLWRRKRRTSEDYYVCLYVGVAIKESVRDRLNWHINQRHTENAIKSGTLSTLRRTLSSLVAGDQYDEAATNTVIDQMVVEYYAMDYPIRSELAKTELIKIENSEMEQHILPLNIMGNRHAILQSFLADLKKARKASNPHKL